MNAPLTTLRESIAASCRILHREGHEHLTFGHVSARAPDGTFLVKAAGLGLEEIDDGGIGRMDADGKPIGDGPPLHDEMPLHTEIYRARPDVGAVVHTHAHFTVALSISARRLGATSQDAVPFVDQLAYYDSADLITTPEQGADVAACLGDRRGVVMHAHGLVTVGADVEEATVSAVLLERAARLETTAASLGAVHPMSDSDLASLTARFERSHRRRVETIWRYLIRTSG
jgi:L-fuculose-phosphate aldolase